MKQTHKILKNYQIKPSKLNVGKLKELLIELKHSQKQKNSTLESILPFRQCFFFKEESITKIMEIMETYQLQYIVIFLAIQFQSRIWKYCEGSR